MIAVLIVGAWLIALAWLYKLLESAIGFPRVPDLNQPDHDIAPAGSPAVVAIVPACNEEKGIEACLASLLRQDCANLHVIAVDDRSTDGTGRIMDEISRQDPLRLRVLHVAELPPGWLGKTHAMAVAACQAMASHDPVYLLFTDGDVTFQPSAVRRALGRAVEANADHLVLMPTTVAETAREAAVLAYLQAMSLWAVRPWRVSDPRATRDAIGIGAFNLVRAAAYRQIGGFESTPMEVLEDLYLGRRIKWAGLRQEVAIGPGLVQVHWARGARGIVTGLTKNIFAVFRYRPLPLIAAALWVVLFSVAPVAAAILSSTRLAGIIALVSIAGVYTLSARVNRISPFHVLFFPIAGLVGVYAMLRSMFVTIRHKGITWRDTFYSLEELRRKMVRKER